MPQVELAAGTVEYQDTGGDGPVLLFLPGLPGGLAAMMRLRAVRRAPGSWGWMSKRPVPDEVTEDRMMPLRHGRRLADLFPDARLTEIDDSYTLLPEDQPEQLIRAIREFVPAARRNTPLPNNDPIGPALRADRGR